MDNAAKLIFKNKLKEFCDGLIRQRIEAAKTMMGNAQQAANSEEKSSAGDKYETSRAMGHLEKDMHARQLAEHLKELASFQSVNCNLLYEKATAGSFIDTEKISFFIAAGLGKQNFENKPIYFLSPQSPLAKSLMNKKVNNDFVFNKESLVIREIF
jgi:hypothetical protein